MFDLVREWIIHGAFQDHDVSFLDDIINGCNMFLSKYTDRPPPRLALKKDKNDILRIGFESEPNPDHM